MGTGVAHKLIESHPLEGELEPGGEIARVNFGIVPLRFRDPADHDWIEPGDVLRIDGLRAAIGRREPIDVLDVTKRRSFAVRHDLSERQVRIVRAGGLINEFRQRRSGT